MNFCVFSPFHKIINTMLSQDGIAPTRTILIFSQLQVKFCMTSYQYKTQSISYGANTILKIQYKFVEQFVINIY